MFTAVAVKFAREESDTNVLARELILRVTSNFDATAKTLLELLVEDLIHLLPFGEWAASAALLYGLATTMLAEMKNPAVEVFSWNFWEPYPQACTKLNTCSIQISSNQLLKSVWSTDLTLTSTT